MDRAADFFAMGGYAVYVWPAYALAALVMGGMLAATLRTLRRREAEVAERERGANSR